MFKSSLKIAIRNFLRFPFYTAIHVFGLGLGFTAAFLIFIYIRDELGYDQFHHRIEDLYRLHFIGKMGEQSAHSSASPGPAGPHFKNLFPEIEHSCRIKPAGSFSVKLGERSYRETRLAYADSSLFEVFTFQVREGNLQNALNRPGQLVITAGIAKKYFGSSTAVGQVLMLNNESPYQISAVVEDLPENSHFHFDFFLPMADIRDAYIDNWGSTNFHNYFRLRPGTDIISLTEKMNRVFLEQLDLVLKQYLNTTLEAFKTEGNYARVELFPVSKIHLYSDVEEELSQNGSITRVYAFGLVAVIILLLACINFINLSTARAATRAREVGVKKAVGAFRSHLVLQFLAESVLLCFMGMVLAIISISLLTPWFRGITGKDFEFSGIFSPETIGPMLAITALTGLLAGSYPALFLSSFQTARVIKGTLPSSRKSGLRAGLVIFQFFASIVLIILSLSIHRQVDFIQSKNLGFNREHVLVISDAHLLGNRLENFKNELSKLPNIRNISVGAFLPVSDERNTTSLVLGRVPSPEKTLLVNNWWVDFDFLKTMDIPVLQGRNFSRDRGTDSTGVIVNEALAKSLGYPDKNVEGQILSLTGDEGLREFQVIGVVKDFHFLSLHHRIEPLAIFFGGSADYISIRLETGRVRESVQAIESLWKQAANGSPFSSTFLDDRYQQLYSGEIRMGKISFVFSFLAILIACLGLIGLASFTIQQRVKEIGIRKVLGASLLDLLSLVSKDFILLVGAAVLFAWPLSWWLVQQWLKRFVFRMDPGPGLFIGTALGTILIALVIVGLQTMKAARVNPVKSLRTE